MRFQPRDGHGDRAEAANLVLSRHRAAFPGMGIAGRHFCKERQTLALEILEIQHSAAVSLGDPAVHHAVAVQPISPPVQCRAAVNP